MHPCSLLGTFVYSFIQTHPWTIPPATLSTLVKFAQHDDEIVKHYATKVIENVCTYLFFFIFLFLDYFFC